jgi:predicted ABC-type ATPase
LAGTNGAGKSSIGGAMLRESGGDYFNPDEAARKILERRPAIGQTRANAEAWRLGVRQLDRCLRNDRDYFFESTLGGRSIAERLERALAEGNEVRVWYVGLDTPERHVARVAARVATGGHDIPERDIRRRFDESRRNIIRLLPRLTELKVYDNSAEAEPARGETPEPVLVLHLVGSTPLGVPQRLKLRAPSDLRATPEWAKAIVAQALKQDLGTRGWARLTP